MVDINSLQGSIKMNDNKSNVVYLSHHSYPLKVSQSGQVFDHLPAISVLKRTLFGTMQLRQYLWSVFERVLIKF